MARTARPLKIELEEREEIEFENTLDYAVTFRNPTKAFGRKLSRHSTFTDVKPGERVTLPIDRGRILGLTPVKRIPVREVVEDKPKENKPSFK